MATDRIFYFGYGSNLLQERIRLRNPSAVYEGVGLLKDFAVSFFQRPDHFAAGPWGGCGATIVERRGAEVYGAIWSLSTADIPSLDAQEGVKSGLYHVLQSVDVITASGETVPCRTYQGMKDRPFGAPSPFYLDVILRGAVQCRLPEHYVSRLRTVQHNAFPGPCELYEKVLADMAASERCKFEVQEVANACKW